MLQVAQARQLITRWVVRNEAAGGGARPMSQSGAGSSSAGQTAHQVSFLPADATASSYSVLTEQMARTTALLAMDDERKAGSCPLFGRVVERMGI